jgi:predicted RNase H-like HicB family nuclease
MTFTIEFEQETDGRWIAEIHALPGVMVYGDTREEATAKVEALAREVVKSKDLEFAFA